MKSQPITRNVCVFTRFWMGNNLQPQSPRLRDAENTENCDENDAVKWKWFCVRADENNNKKDRHKARIIIQSHWHLSLTLIRLLFAKISSQICLVSARVIFDNFLSLICYSRTNLNCQQISFLWYCQTNINSVSLFISNWIFGLLKYMLTTQ